MEMFIIESTLVRYENPSNNAERLQGRFVLESTKPIIAFYNDKYIPRDERRRKTIGTVENTICTLKNQFRDKRPDELDQATSNLRKILNNDLPQILKKTRKNNLTVCVVPRAKTSYYDSQLLFKKTISDVVDNLPNFSNGVNYIRRNTDTRTTHMRAQNDGGDMPYPGITKKTCDISEEVKGRDILLIDDLYTRTVNIDEDAIQALLDNGAESVVFYSIGYTMRQIPGTTIFI